MKLRRYKKKKISSYFTFPIIIIMISLVSAFFIIDYFNDSVNEIILPMAEASTRKYVATIIKNSTDGLDLNNQLFVIEKDQDNEIKMITYNSLEVTKLTNEVTQNIQENLVKLENDSFDNSEDFVIEEIPIGVIFNNPLLRNMGPRIKLRIDIIGDVLTELQTEIKPYGINNALVEVKIYIDCTARVVLPFVSKEIKVSNVVPISINIVNGSIPEAYIASYQ